MIADCVGHGTGGPKIEHASGATKRRAHVFTSTRGSHLDKRSGMQDLRFALRAFRRTPGTSSLVVTTLAVAIAAATIIASTIDMVWRFIPNRTDRRPGVRRVDRSAARTIAVGGRGRRRAHRRVDSRPGRLDRAHEQLSGICGRHLSERHHDGSGRAVAHLDGTGHAQPSACLGHHASSSAARSKRAMRHPAPRASCC